jgi:hypothetical protein
MALDRLDKMVANDYACVGFQVIQYSNAQHQPKKTI